MSGPTLILASASPRRRELLEKAQVRFEVIPAPTPEPLPAPGEAPQRYATRAAREKALAVARLPQAQGRWILGADTIVVLDSQIFGKPTDPDDAKRMLQLLQGKTHRVLTAFVLLDPHAREAASACVATEVDFHPMNDERVTRYVAGGEPLDKAGAYAIQGEGAFLVAAVRGSYSNVIGLPLDEILAALKTAGIEGAGRG